MCLPGAAQAASGGRLPSAAARGRIGPGLPGPWRSPFQRSESTRFSAASQRARLLAGACGMARCVRGFVLFHTTSLEETKTQHSSPRRAVLHAAAVVTLSLAAASAQALSTDPLDFVPAPEGANLSVLYYQHNSSSAQYANGCKVGSADVKADIGIARFGRYTKV